MICLRYRGIRRQGQPLARIAHARFFQSTPPSTKQKSSTDRDSLRLLNKSLYDTSLKCDRLGWYARRNLLPSDNEDHPNDPMKDFLMRQGLWFESYVYRHKYGYHPIDNHNVTFPSQPSNIAIIHEATPIEAAEATEILMQSQDSAIDTILQPTFLCNNKVARADVAVRTFNDSGDVVWEILEIKSSTEKSFRKKVPDLAYTVSLARSVGYIVNKASLILVDPAFVQSNTQDDSENLLYKTVDCTKLVDEYIIHNEMDAEAERIDTITSGDIPPPVKFKLACGKCELLGVECGPHASNSTSETKVRPLEHGVWELPRLSQKQFPDVLERSLPTLELKDLDLEPDDAELLTKNQAKFFQAVATNAVVVEQTQLKKQLQKIANTGQCIRYLDFEAVSVLDPPYQGMTPYETMITQYSLHKVDNQTQELSHFAYLSDPQKDCRKELLEQLLEELGYGNTNFQNNGPILVYSSYEKTQLKKLATLFPEYSDCVTHIIEHRLVDLEKIIKDCVSHPDFRGRSSIKVTLPALVPGFEKAYHDLSKSGIADGGTASAAFADLISGDRSGAREIEQTRKALLEYCKLDTLALVEIHKALWNLIEDGSS